MCKAFEMSWIDNEEYESFLTSCNNLSMINSELLPHSIPYMCRIHVAVMQRKVFLVTAQPATECSAGDLLKLSEALKYVFNWSSL